MLFNLVGRPDPAKKLPEFTYTGTCRLTDKGANADGTKRWELECLTSGVLTFARSTQADAFLVGGGGGSSGGGVHYAGAGGGYTKTVRAITLGKDVGYTVTIGAGGGIDADGGDTHISGGSLNLSCSGGCAPTSIAGGAGGSGGAGGGTENSGTWGGDGGEDGSDGGQGYSAASAGGKGQGSTTRAFGESEGTLYAGGGAGDGKDDGGTGGAGGGGSALQDGLANTGGGAGGARQYGSYGRCGGSGIVIFRDAR